MKVLIIYSVRLSFLTPSRGLYHLISHLFVVSQRKKKSSFCFGFFLRLGGMIEARPQMLWSNVQIIH